MRAGYTSLRFNQSPKLSMILQDERAGCGHACVIMICNFFGHQLDLHSLRSISNTSVRGVTLLDIHQLLGHLGLTPRPLKVPLEELYLVKCPAILHWDMNHFVVLKEVKKTHIVIHDPAIGIRHCRFDDVSKSFTGIVLEVEKSNDFKEIRSQNKLTLGELVKSIYGINKFLILLLAISLVIEILSLLNPLFIQYVTDDVIGFSERGNLYIIATGFLILALIQVFTEYIRGNMIIYFTNHLTEQFASNVVKHILKLPLTFFEKRHKGDLQSKFQAIDQIQKKISTDFIATVLDGFMIIANIVVMTIYSSVLTMLVVTVLFISLIFRYVSYYHLKMQTESSIHQHAKAMTIFLETLQCIIPIKSFLKEHVRFNTWRNCYIDSLNADINVSKMHVIYQVINQLLFYLEQILVVSVGASLVLSNQFSVGMLIAFLSYRLLLVNKASSLIQKIFDYKLISIQLHRLSDILFQQPENIATGYGMTSEVNGELRLEHIFFKYNQNDRDILTDINLIIQANEKVVIVGRSGGGKSTLLKIMMGLLENTRGEIYIDDCPLREFGLKNYRYLTASVMQEDTLLSGSIMENISFFDEMMNMERIVQVAKLAYIHEEISKLPMGYETLVGDMGSTLSGGQKQRILLARALYKQPKILFLDEATSHLDINNEININRSLKSLNITQIIIAHRKETIQMADRIIDLDLMQRNI